MARGEPGVPRRFRWRDTEYVVVDVGPTKRETGAHDSYVRRHVTDVRTEDGSTFRIVSERGAGHNLPRWWVRTVEN